MKMKNIIWNARFSRSCIFVLMTALMCSFAQAELMVYEGFNYPNTPLANQDGGYGWSVQWEKDYSGGASTGPSTLTVDPWQGLEMTPYTFGGAMGCAYTSTPVSESLGTRKFGSQIPMTADGTYYFSVMIKPVANRYVILSFGSLGNSFYDMLKFAWSGDKLEFSIRDGGSMIPNVYTDPNSCLRNEVSFIVIKLVVSQDSDDQAFIKIYDQNDIFDIDDAGISWDASVSGNCSDQIQAFRISAGSNAGTYIDELRIGTEWVDVVPGKAGFVRSEPLPGMPHSDPNLLVYEGFYYEGTNLGNGNGGFGWQGPWFGSVQLETDPNVAYLTGPSNVDITANKILDMDNLPFVPMGGAVLEAIEDVCSSNYDLAYRHLEDAALVDLDSNDTYYISYLFRRDDGGGSSGEYFALSLRSRGSTGVYNSLTLEVTTEEAYRIEIYDNDSGSRVSTVGPPWSFETRKSYLFVAKIATQSSNPGNYDQVFLKVYDSDDTIDLTEPATWTLQSGMSANCDSTANTILFFGGTSAVYSLDELRIGKTWASVVNPEPVCGQTTGDFDGDCDTDFSDFAIFADNWLE